MSREDRAYIGTRVVWIAVLIVTFAFALWITGASVSDEQIRVTQQKAH